MLAATPPAHQRTLRFRTLFFCLVIVKEMRNGTRTYINACQPRMPVGITLVGVAVRFILVSILLAV